MSDVAHVMNVPAFDGHAGSLANYEENAGLGSQTSTTGQDKRAANLLLHMSGVAREVCMTVGKDVVRDIDGVEQISRILREHLAPDAICNIFQAYGPGHGHVPDGIRHVATKGQGAHDYGGWNSR